MSGKINNTFSSYMPPFPNESDITDILRQAFAIDAALAAAGIDTTGKAGTDGYAYGKANPMSWVARNLLDSTRDASPSPASSACSSRP